MDLRSSFSLDQLAACEARPDLLDPRGYSARDKSRDGTFVHVRAIRPDDAERLIECFTAMSPESIRARWHGMKSAMTAGEIVAATAVDPNDHVGLVATVWIDGGERIIGLASFFVDSWSEPRCAEVALTVLDAWQGRGIGSILFGHLARLAHRCGVEELTAEVLVPNTRMLRIFVKSGLPVEVERAGPEARVRLALAS
jgi:GNAT superfamily N-acetyltransferase